MGFSYGRAIASSVLVCALSLLCASPGFALDAFWVYPPANTLLPPGETEVFAYALDADSDTIEIEVTTEDPEDPGANVSAKRLFAGIFTAKVELKPGRTNLLVGSDALALYVAEKGGEDVPADFLSLVKHAVDSRCYTCHGEMDGQLTLLDRSRDLCLSTCHTIGTETAYSVIRENAHFKEVAHDCFSCHEYHGSQFSGLTKGRENTCTGCHEDKSTGAAHEKSVEQPCVGCHDPHWSALDEQLRLNKPFNTCKKCHADIRRPKSPPKSRHAPLDQGCDTCHTAHDQGPRHMLKVAAPTICMECHGDYVSSEHVTETSECRICHEPHTSSEKGLLSDKVSGYCTDCHEELAELEDGHAAIEEGGCTSCHNPHEKSSDMATAETCNKCHDVDSYEFRSIHGQLPMESGVMCARCHDPHASEHKSLLKGTVHYPVQRGGCDACHDLEGEEIVLVEERQRLCIKCHGHITGTSTITDTNLIHKPVAQLDCIGCHNPHVSINIAQLHAEPIELCDSCHGMLLRDSKNIHGLFEDGFDCLTCHLPHISDDQPLLAREPRKLCSGCHRDVVPENRSERKLMHGALAKGRCSDCHNPHASDHDSILKESADELCASCHEAVVLDEQGEQQDYLHGPVATTDCTACHLLKHSHEVKGDDFLKSSGWKICRSCHDTQDSHIPPKYRTRMSGGGVDCLDCHLPHGSDNRFMLKQKVIY